ncbi:MAG: sensor histidine kinase [Candidatus Binatia bacterium]|nr:sensor histidine kinase [Candidatus Binatia bacterium]
MRSRAVVTSAATPETRNGAWVLCTERVHDRAYHMLGARTIEGLIVLGILEFFYADAIQQLVLSRFLFAVYFLVNLILVIPQRKRAMTPALAWLDLIGNLAPMAAAAHWSGGIYSPILPVFVLKIGNYGLIYSVQTGKRAFFTTVALLAAFSVTSYAGLGPSSAIHLVPERTRQQLTFFFGVFLFLIGCYGALRFFRELSDRERRLAAALEEQRSLYGQLLKDRDRLRQLSQRLVEISEDTMQAVSRELHDDFGQALTAARLDLGRIERQLPAASDLRQQVREVRQQLAAMLENVRNLSQVLRPAALDDLGLMAALESYAERFAERSGVHIDLHLPAQEPALGREAELTLYRTLQEALTNVARHARATHVTIALDEEEGRVRLRIRDNGKGFVTEGEDRSRPGLGLGIAGMRERAELYGGRLLITSQPGQGTEVLLELPIGSKGEGIRGKGAKTHYRATG